MPKYKTGDYIIVGGGCKPEVHGKTVRIANIVDDCYFIDLLDNGDYRPWKIVIADANTTLDIAKTVLFKDTTVRYEHTK